PVIEALLVRGGDSADPAIPWLLWWAIESKAISDHERVVAFFATAENRTPAAVQANLGRLVRRYAAEGTATGYSAAHKLLTALTPAERQALLADLDRGLAERAVGLPPVGQGGLFDALAPPGAAPPKPRKYEPLTPELKELIRVQWSGTKTSELTTRLALRAGI